MVDRSVIEQTKGSASVAQSGPAQKRQGRSRPAPDGHGPSGPAADGHARDYYDRDWGRFISRSSVDASEEPWVRQLPLMRVFGAVVFAVALATGYPRADPGGWHGPLSIAIAATLMVAFWIMWVRKPIWQYSTRVLAVHGAFQLIAYAALVSLSPPFAVLQLIVYPQVVFSLPTRFSVAGALFIGAFTGAVFMANSRADPAAGLAWLVANLLIAALVVAIGVWMRLTIAQSMERRALIEELSAARQELAAAERDAAVAEERGRLARDIHDTLAQGFASVVTHLEAADACLEADPARARDDVTAAVEVARSSLAEARTLVWALRPESIAAAGLPAAIERLAATAGGTGAALVEVAIAGQSHALHPDVEVTLLRAAQEALNNARRHASASRVTLTLTYFGDEVSLDVIDDGRGFDVGGAAGSGGMGLLGMRERAERLGGRLVIESAPGEGAAVAVTLPAIEPPGQTAASAPRADAGAGR